MTNVAIVGAGCAGLGAAATLLEKSNANVWIFEALGRVGGRTWTYSPTLPVDLGAEAIEQAGSNPWLKIAKTLKVDLTSASPNTIYRVFEKGTWSSEADTPDIKQVMATLDASYTRHRESPNLPVIGSLHGWGELSPQMVSLALSSSALASIKESAEPWQFVAADMYRQEQEGPEDDQPPKFPTGGIGGLVTKYAAWLQTQYKERLRIQLNADVERVDCETGKLALSGEDPVASDYCIVTAPVSSLPLIAFTPPLSYRQIVAYRNLKLGSYKKVGFRPKTPPTGGDAIEADTNYYIYDPALGGSWQYSWLPTDPTVLVCLASGNFAARLDWTADDVVLAGLLQLLKRAHANGDFTPKLGPDQAPEVAISNWTRTMYIRGAYSYTVYDGGRPDDPVPLAAREWIVDPQERAYFAGEANWVENYGTIAGAYYSGARAAGQLIEDRGLPGPGQ
ncbi:MAG TPA: NAD(P)/FAD-dependent oxidoreductase [Allosphingosinicella sp.]|nr:NAD(P)/FAD-dependent oxidoreductase [Allosphingosinicella sp.]